MGTAVAGRTPNAGDFLTSSGPVIRLEAETATAPDRAVFVVVTWCGRSVTSPDLAGDGDSSEPNVRDFRPDLQFRQEFCQAFDLGVVPASYYLSLTALAASFGHGTPFIDR